MNLLITLFWIFLAILFYCYAGYGILLYIARSLGRKRNATSAANAGMPAVTLVVTAYLEDRILEDKIINSLNLGYPLEIIFVIDGKTKSLDLFKNHPNIKCLHQEERLGKYNAIRLAMKEVRTPFVIFSDANSMLNKGCVQRIIAHYADPHTGGVAGEKKINELGSSAFGEAEGLYWKYESFTKELDANFYTVIGAAGELYSIRTELFKPVLSPVVLDDFLISMQVCLQGYRIAYEPGAFALESDPGNFSDEKKRRIRIAAGGFQSLTYLSNALNFLRHPVLAFQFFSRRILRWIVCPILIPLVFMMNCMIVYRQQELNVFAILLACQLLFYLLAVVGWLIIRSGKKAGWLSIPFYFLFMNYCTLKGLFRFLGKKQPAAWEKTER